MLVYNNGNQSVLGLGGTGQKGLLEFFGSWKGCFSKRRFFSFFLESGTGLSSRRREVHGRLQKVEKQVEISLVKDEMMKDLCMASKIKFMRRF